MIFPEHKTVMLYVGTYTKADAELPERSEGIFVYKLDPITGCTEFVQAVSGFSNPSYLALTPDHRFLYAVNELAEFQGQAGGGVSAFAVDPASGRLDFINSQPTFGAHPCYLSIDALNKFVWVANYNGGSITVLPLKEETLGEPATVIQHVGHGPNPQRQEKPHVHSVTLAPGNQFALAADLGIDKIVVYRTSDIYQNYPADPVFEASAKPGAGPRHLAFHPNGRFVYAVNELDAALSAYTFDGARGTLAQFQNLPTLPVDFQGVNLCADIHLTPSGDYLYVSNRGHDCIAAFAVDHSTGQLVLLSHTPTLGKFPRNFTLTPDARLLLAANQKSDSIAAFQIDAATGGLTPTGEITRVPAPVCIQVVSI